MRIGFKETILILVMLLIVLPVVFGSAIPYPYATNPFNADLVFDLNDDCDEKLGGTDCSLVGNPAYNTSTPFSSGKSVFVDGTGDAIDSNTHNFWADGAHAFCFWWKPWVIADTDMILSSESTTMYYVFWYRTTQMGYMNYPTSGKVDWEKYLGAQEFMDTQSWEHWCVVHDIGNGVAAMHVYHNGTELTGTAILDQGVGNVQLPVDVYFGADNYDGVVRYESTGNLDDILIWEDTKRPTAEQIYTIWKGNYTAADTCTCPGIDTDWEVELSDNCDIVDACDLGTGDLSFIGTGNFTCNATLDAANIWFNNSVSAARYITGKDCRMWVGS